MRRRDFLTLAAATTAFPSVALAQQAAKVPRIVYLSIPFDPAPSLNQLRQGLADNGYVEGKDVVIEVVIPPTYADFPAYIPNVITGNPAVIVTYGTPGSLQVKAATSTIPLVFLNATDPVATGLVTNLGHPGGNVTGTAVFGPDVIGKEMALLKEIVPEAKRWAVIVFPADPVTALYRQPVQTAAQILGIEPVFIEFVEGQDYATQFRAVLAANAQAGYNPSYTELGNVHSDQLFDLYLVNRLPVMCSQPINRGTATPFYGVIQYFADNPTIVRTRGAALVAAILGGAKPGDLPVEQATTFDLGVNLDMAKKIGVTIPPDILAQATLVIDYDLRAPKAEGK